MTFKGTYRDLLALRLDLVKQSRESIAFRYLHQKQIDFFNQFNKVELKKVDNLDKALVRKYVDHDANLNPVIDRREGNMVFYRFNDHAAKENFTREYQKLMQTECTIGI